MDSILVVCDLLTNKSHQYCLDIVSKATVLSEQKKRIIVVVVGPRDNNLEMQLYQFGSDCVFWYAVNRELIQFSLEKSLMEIISVHLPNLIIFPSNDILKPIAATIAVNLKCGLVADCIEIQRDTSNGYIFTRTAMSTTMIAQIICIHSSASVCTVKPMAFREQSAEIPGKYGKLPINLFHEKLDPPEKERMKIVHIENNPNYLNQRKCTIENAKIIFGVGRGVAREDIPVLHKIAVRVGAEIGYTRSMVEADPWLKPNQIGQSGVIVKPKLYVAFGISGANQHLVGIDRSKMIISINRDKNAPIFSMSDYAILGDTHEIISHMSNNILNKSSAINTCDLIKI